METILDKEQRWLESRRKYSRAYYARHRAERLAYQNAYNKEHAEHIKEYAKGYYEANREKRNAYMREYQRKRRAQNKGA